jgi:hypothetical protein
MNKSWPVVFTAVLMVLAVSGAWADKAKDGADNMARLMGAPAGMAVGNAAVAEDDDVIRLTPDKTKIIHLTQDAASVVVTNPAHASVLLDSPRVLVVMPRVPGTTSFTVLNANSKVIAEKTVIVSAANKAKYVRIRKICDGTGGACVPTSYYYCPDGCYEVLTVPPDNGATQVPDLPARTVNIEQNNANPPPAPDASQGGAIPQNPPPAPPSNIQEAPAK